MLRIFVIEYADGRKLRIKAARFMDRGGYGYCFYNSDKRNLSVQDADARVESLPSSSRCLKVRSNSIVSPSLINESRSALYLSILVVIVVLLC